MNEPPKMPLKVLVVDDEPLARTDLEVLLRAEPDLHLLPGVEDGESALAALAKHRPDVLFLDIRMPGLDGFEVLARIDPLDLPMVVFVSAYDEFALDAFAVSALDYLMKPVRPARLRETLARVRSRRDDRWREHVVHEIAELRALYEGLIADRPLSAEGPFATRLAVRDAQRIRFVAVESIDWIEADRNYCVLHTPQGRLSLRATISDLERRLDPRAFSRIHRSTIVALGRIREMRPTFRGEYSVTLEDGTVLHWTRGYLAALQKVLEPKEG